MARICLALLVATLLPGVATAQVLFSYEDLDPDATSPVNLPAEISIVGANAGGRTGVGEVTLLSVAEPTSNFFSLQTAPTTIDLTNGGSPFNGKSFNATADVYIPSSSPINEGDSIFVQVDYFNSAIGVINNVPSSFERFSAGFFNDTTPTDEWFTINLNGVIPDLTGDFLTVDSVNTTVVFTDGGFGGTSNDSTGSPFALIDNFAYTISEPTPPGQPFFQSEAPGNGGLNTFGTVLTSAADPLDPGNQVGLVSLETASKFTNVSFPGTAEAAPVAGEKFRASFDYLVPADTAFAQDEGDTFWLQLGFFDPISGSASFEGGGPTGENNSDSAGFPGIAAVSDGQWRTIEIEGTVPADSNGASYTIVMVDNGFGGDTPNTVGDAFFIDNLLFEVIDRVEGDYNDDGVVDAADYTVWRDNDGTAAPSAPFFYRDATNSDGEEPINHNGDGLNGVTAADYDLWVASFGGGASAGQGVPEPGSILLASFAAVAVIGARRS